MADSEIQVSPDSTGKSVDTSAVTTGAGTVQRQRVAVGDGSVGGQLLTIEPSGAAKVDGSAVTQPVSGSVAVSNLPATQPISAAALPLPAGAAADGTDGSGIAQPTGGAGIRGWLSGIYKALVGTLAVDASGHTLTVDASGHTVPVSGTFWQTTQPVSGTVTAQQGSPPWNVEIPTVAAPNIGQQKVAVGGTAVKLIAGATPAVQGVVVQALKGNTDQVYVGLTGVTTTHDGTGNGWELQPGQCTPVIPVNDASLIFFNSATAGSAVCWIGV